MTTYTYAGPATNLARFGPVQTGAKLELTDQEVASVAGDPNFIAPQKRTILERTVTGDAMLGPDDNGKRIVCRHGAPVTLTLPANPPPGCSVHIAFGDTAGADNVTIGRNGHTIDGSASDLTLTAALDSVALYFDATGWKTF